ncbi:hypothetical protein HG535_0G00860 [Zygotorulaspora mrakii]|uniref:MIP18 family-like domain-containing protein n=1 Tax=Zygotorulaspora mrakii TaxID=42260 RepID=A0A7H9B8Y6_ZYGMR|nr:uncharacterized protein HG535_0G00860 [Zygotorulaspora mrakii]QLG74202.1 hypothetical protein HG535_0G00860 [Zygotorulaspora mrakii]
MSEFINENPVVLDNNQLPSRKDGGSQEFLLGDVTDEESVQRKKLLFKLDHSAKSPALESVELLDRLLLLDAPPDLTSDEESEETEEDFHDASETEKADPIDAQEIYDLLAHITDPEHPISLGQLSVVNLEDIEVHDSGNKEEMAEVIVRITPTITHCSLATLIGLGIRVRLDRALNPRFRITILLKKGSHQSENQVNKQLNDKERVAAACENDQLLSVVSKMLSTCK